MGQNEAKGDMPTTFPVWYLTFLQSAIGPDGEIRRHDIAAEQSGTWHRHRQTAAQQQNKRPFGTSLYQEPPCGRNICYHNGRRRYLARFGKLAQLPSPRPRDGEMDACSQHFVQARSFQQSVTCHKLTTRALVANKVWPMGMYRHFCRKFATAPPLADKHARPSMLSWFPRRDRQRHEKCLGRRQTDNNKRRRLYNKLGVRARTCQHWRRPCRM